MVEVAWSYLAPVDPGREYLGLFSYLPRKGFWSIFSFLRQRNAIQEQLDGKTTDWMEKVSDEQYHT